MITIAGSSPACTSDCDDVGCAGRIVLAFDSLPDGPSTTFCIDDVCGEVTTERIAESGLTAIPLERGSSLDRGPDTSAASLSAGGGTVEAMLPAGYRPSNFTVRSSWRGKDFTARADVASEVVARTSCENVPCYGANLTLDPRSGELRQSTAEGPTR
jgi:hypothetical protein